MVVVVASGDVDAGQCGVGAWKTGGLADEKLAGRFPRDGTP